MVKQVKFIFDNSNLNESYAGVITPLTYSFAKRAYEKVYINFCKLLGVSNKNINQHSDLFPNMLEYIGGRMYYNLINWYRLVALLPGYKFNRKFLEQMLGVDKEHYYKPEKPSSPIEKARDFLNLLYRMTRVFLSFLFMKTLVRRFNDEFDQKLTYINKTTFKNKSDLDLVKFYEGFEEKLTKDFSIPIANDFAVMVSVGILKSLSSKWLKDKDGSKTSYFISGGVGLKSAEPGKALQDIVKSINSDKKSKRLFVQKSPAQILSKLVSDKYFITVKNKIYSYIDIYGFRIPGELKLETVSFQDDPLVLLKILKNSLNNRTKIPINSYNLGFEKEVDDLSLLRKLFFNFILKWSQSSISMREETRFKRTLIFGTARKVFKEFGIRLNKHGKLKNSRDVFYLTVDEIFSYYRNGKQPKIAFTNLVLERKGLRKVWEDIDLPRRISTNLSPKDYNIKLLNTRQEKLEPYSKSIKVTGQIASFGFFGPKVKAKSLVVLDFDPSINYTDKILVTKQTDPGWTLVFPALKGLVVERGGVLSHAAIVAREYGIPCIINATNATKIIPDKKEIQMDLEQGVVTLNE